MVSDDSPPMLSGQDILTQFRDFGVFKTTDVGGNGHVPIYGYGLNHNWHKKVSSGIYRIGRTIC